ncbi:unnamed protein product [Heligmosomoides polygyrus]|uniref:C2H2-type domain-containing protein n=1 Tax=Heligmosomoides polygyrus TaxID=6339 RepID=A0A3P8DP89_HELPZ|nr:unnamed protein product [Heligmosomoides polygyrus]
MSRRKQLKPQPVKDDVGSQSCTVNGDESKSKKRRLLFDNAQVKSEPCDDETKSEVSSVTNELKLLDCQFCGAAFESISDLQTHTLRDHLPMVSRNISRATPFAPSTRLSVVGTNSREPISAKVPPTRRPLGKSLPEPTGQPAIRLLLRAGCLQPRIGWGPVSMSRGFSPGLGLRGEFRSVPLAMRKTFHLQPVPSLECQHCFAMLPSFAAFVIHMRGHLNDLRKPVRFCAECGMSCGDAAAFGQHFIEHHLRLQHLCAVCGQTRPSEAVDDNQCEFQEHVLSHSNELMSLECGQCRLGFESRELLAMHVQLVHDRDQASDKTDSAPSPIRNGHITMPPSIQKEIRILHCSVCDEKCYGEDALDEHRLFSHCKVNLITSFPKIPLVCAMNFVFISEKLGRSRWFIFTAQLCD